MWHKAIWKGHPMRLELTRVGLLAELANHYTTRGSRCLSQSVPIYQSIYLSIKNGVKNKLRASLVEEFCIWYYTFSDGEAIVLVAQSAVEYTDCISAES